MFSLRIVVTALIAPLWLGACTSLPVERGRADIRGELAVRGLATADTAADTAALTQQWLGEPLSVARAVQIALLHNPELAAVSAQLGLSAADVYEAGRLSNPVLSAAWLSPGREPHAQLTLGVAVNFTDLLMLRARSRIADAEFDSSKLTIGKAALDLAARVEAAYWQLAAATQTAELQATLAQAAQNSATLAQRYFDAGNLKRRDLALEQAAATQAALDAGAAQLGAELAHGELNRLMGLATSDGGWTLAEKLSLPPAHDEALTALLQMAGESRLDIAAARRHADAVAARYGLTRHTQGLGDIELGAERESEFDGSVHGGPTLAITLPLFDWGSGRKARAAAELQIAEAALRARELDADADVQAAYARLSAARAAVERYRTQLIPAREQVVEQMQREFNYMLVDVFELLAARQQGYMAYAGYLDALRDYWVARAELARAVGRRLPDGEPGPAALHFDDSRPQLDTAPAPAAAPMAMPHMEHDNNAAPPATPAAHEHEHEHEHGAQP